MFYGKTRRMYIIFIIENYSYYTNLYGSVQTLQPNVKHYVDKFLDQATNQVKL